MNSSTADVDNSSKIQNAGHLAITDDGQYILCSNRGILNSIVVFQLKDPVNGTLELRNSAGSGGYHPRYFAIYENFLVVANMVIGDLHTTHQIEL